MKIKKYLWVLLLLFVIGGCESLEDTYSDYAGDGAIRYLGKCKNLSVSPGWKRLIVQWDNHVDPVIDKIKVSWTIDRLTRDTILEKGTTECNIPNLINGTYEISVSSMDKDGNCSLPILAYERPYTAAHENVLSFTRVVNKHFFVKDRLALIFTDWYSNLETAELNYYSGGKIKVLELDSTFITDNKCFLLPDEIDSGTKVIVKRTGRLEGCSDLITFDTYELTDDKIYTPEFKQLLRKQYGQTEVSEAFLGTLKELYFDYNMETFEDILNIPGLKTLVLGKNRYLNEQYLDYYEDNSEVSAIERSIFALKVANEVLGLKVKRYNKHYFSDENFPFMKEMGNPALPEYKFFDNQQWTYSCSNEEYEEGIEDLFDENIEGGWEPVRHTSPCTYDIIVDMQESKIIKGVQITQKLLSPTSKYAKLIAKKIQIKVSNDRQMWNDATYVEENTLGNTSGETTVIGFSNIHSARYLKFIVSDQAYNSFYYSISLGKIKIF